MIIYLMSALLTFFAGVLKHDLTNIKLRRYRISSGKVKKDARFVVIADLHGRSFGAGNAELIRRIDEVKPDFVIMAGDIMTAKDPFFPIERGVDRAVDLVAALSQRYPVYFGPGNHEMRVKWEQWRYSFKYEDMMSRFKDAGAVILDNSGTDLAGYGIRISALNMPQRFFKKGSKGLHESDMQKMMGSAAKREYQILIAHDPEYIPTYAAWGADLSLSGHYHGGLIRLPLFGPFINPKLEIFPKFAGGAYHRGGKRQLVSCGLGTHTYPLRLFNPAELMCVELKCER